jgi:hypothetical protein
MVPLTGSRTICASPAPIRSVGLSKAWRRYCPGGGTNRSVKSRSVQQSGPLIRCIYLCRVPHRRWGDAEDVMSETFERALRDRDSFDPQSR